MRKWKNGAFLSRKLVLIVGMIVGGFIAIMTLTQNGLVQQTFGLVTIDQYNDVTGALRAVEADESAEIIVLQSHIDEICQDRRIEYSGQLPSLIYNQVVVVEHSTVQRTNEVLLGNQDRPIYLFRQQTLHSDEFTVLEPYLVGLVPTYQTLRLRIGPHPDC